MFLQTFPKVDKSRLPFSHPQYFLYEFPEDVDSVIIKVASEKAYPCSVVSVQNIMVSSDPVSLLARKILMFQNRGGEGLRHPLPFITQPDDSNISCTWLSSPCSLTLIRNKTYLIDTKKRWGMETRSWQKTSSCKFSEKNKIKAYTTCFVLRLLSQR